MLIAAVAKGLPVGFANHVDGVRGPVGPSPCGCGGRRPTARSREDASGPVRRAGPRLPAEHAQVEGEENEEALAAT
eukprot:scaffold4331_cov400-Prasinococcus_capsulatus_cf.AAC.3